MSKKKIEFVPGTNIPIGSRIPNFGDSDEVYTETVETSVAELPGIAELPSARALITWNKIIDMPKWLQVDLLNEARKKYGRQTLVPLIYRNNYFLYKQLYKL